MNAPSTTAQDFDSCRRDSAGTCGNALGTALAPSRVHSILSALAATLLITVAGIAVIHPAPAAAVYAHPEAKASFGSDGTSGTTISQIRALAYQQTTKRLYVMSGGSPTQLHALTFNAPGTYTPLGGSFPLALPYTGANQADIGVDNTSNASAGNLYITGGSSQGEGMEGFRALGSPLPGWPVLRGGSACGADVDNEGFVWMSHVFLPYTEKYNSGGAGIQRIEFDNDLYHPCRTAIDRSNNDLFIANSQWNPKTPGVYRFSKASGYAPKQGEKFDDRENAELAVNASKHILYVAGGERPVAAYDTITKQKLESFGPTTVNGIDVDEATDTVLLSNGATEKVEEWRGAIVAEAITGDPIANKEVSGSVKLSGGGEVTNCYFEYNLTPSQDPPASYPDTTPCDPAAPFQADQSVTAVLPGLEGESTYHYRLAVTNSGGTVHGEDRTITPHHVDSLKTEAADEIERTTVRLRASFLGTGEAHTNYYFEWGKGASGPYESQTDTPPGADVGLTNGPTPLSTPLAGLTAGNTYHYRVVASNSLGTSFGNDVVFETAPAVKLATNPPSGLTPTSGTLEGEIDPDGYATTYYFEYGSTTNYGATAPPAPGVDLGTTAPGITPVSVDLPSLKAGATYHYRLVATNSFGTTRANDQTFRVPEAPLIESFTSTDVTPTSAKLVAKINPRGEETTYRFEYGLTPIYGAQAPQPDGVLPAGEATQEVSVQLDDLPGGTYHFRVVATSKWGTTTTGDQVFTFYPPDCPNAHLRQQTGAGYLPDCRAYELVSPDDVSSAVLFAEATPSTASDPPRFAFKGEGGVIPNAGEAAAAVGDLYVATRTLSGWTTRYVGLRGYEGTVSGGPPNTVAAPSGVYASLSMDEFMSWDHGQGGYTCCGNLGSWSPFVWDSQGEFLRRLPTNIGEIPNGTIDLSKGAFEGDARPSPDFSRYFFSSRNVPFAAGGLEVAPGTAYANNLETGEISVISKVGGVDIPAGTGGSTEYIRFPAVSPDGSHAVMSTEAGNENHLYIAIEGQGSFDVSLGSDGKNHPATLGGMTADGSKVYFTSPDQLTTADQDASTDLYLWSEGPTPTVTLVSTGTGGSGNADMLRVLARQMRCRRRRQQPGGPVRFAETAADRQRDRVGQRGNLLLLAGAARQRPGSGRRAESLRLQGWPPALRPDALGQKPDPQDAGFARWPERGACHRRAGHLL